MPRSERFKQGPWFKGLASNKGSPINQGPITFWEKVAESRWGRYISEVERQAIIKAHHLAGKPTRAIEVGCEGGRWAKLLSDLGWELLCTDVNQEALDICQRRIPGAKCFLMDPGEKELPSETKSLGLILCIEVFPVIESEWFLSEAHRALVNEGILVGVFLNRRSLRGLFVRAMENGKGEKPFRHYQKYYSRWKREMLEGNFKILAERGFCWFPLHRSSDSRVAPIFASIEHQIGLDKLVNISPWIIFIAQKDHEPEAGGARQGRSELRYRTPLGR